MGHATVDAGTHKVGKERSKTSSKPMKGRTAEYTNPEPG